MKLSTVKNFFGKANILMVQKILGRTGSSNLSLSNQTVTWGEEKNGEPHEKNQWTAVLAAHRNSQNLPASCLLVRLYESARTYFQQNT